MIPATGRWLPRWALRRRRGTVGRFDLVVAATPDPEWTRRAFHLLEPEGVVESLAGFADPTVLMWAMYGLGVFADR